MTQNWLACRVMGCILTKCALVRAGAPLTESQERCVRGKWAVPLHNGSSAAVAAGNSHRQASDAAAPWPPVVRDGKNAAVDYFMAE